MTDGTDPVAWSGRRAVVTFPVHAGTPEAARIGAQLDTTIHEIRNHIFRSRPPDGPF